MFHLLTDENGEEQRKNFVCADRALTAWKRAVRRNTCFSAQLYNLQTGELIADYQSE